MLAGRCARKEEEMNFNWQRENKSAIQTELHINKSPYLGLVLSGFGYTYRNPLLYYSTNILLELGIDCIEIDFKYPYDDSFISMSPTEKDQYFENDCKIVLENLVNIIDNYKNVVLIGKSLGTSIIRKLLKNDLIQAKAIIVLLTPGNEWSNFIPELVKIDNFTFVATSNEDINYKVPNLLDFYKKKNLTLIELSKGDHSLEVNKIENDIEILRNVIIKEKEFVEMVLEKLK